MVQDASVSLFQAAQQWSTSLTDQGAYTLVANIRQQRGNDAALFAAGLLARRRARRVSTAGA